MAEMSGPILRRYGVSVSGLTRAARGAVGDRKEIAVKNLQLGYAVAAVMGLVTGVTMVGCVDNRDPVPRAAPVAVGPDTYRQEHEAPKPLPPPYAADVRPGPQPFYDEPLMVDTPAEAKAFVEIYHKVGSPRILVIVNRLEPGQHDELQARNIDYNLIETLMTDWMSADNQVTLVSSAMARRKLSNQQMKDLRAEARRRCRRLARSLGRTCSCRCRRRPHGKRATVRDFGCWPRPSTCLAESRWVGPRWICARRWTRFSSTPIRDISLAS